MKPIWNKGTQQTKNTGDKGLKTNMAKRNIKAEEWPHPNMSKRKVSDP
jgi:hypothetical protein